MTEQAIGVIEIRWEGAGDVGRDISALAGEVRRWRKALTELTSGGSEFADDPETCVRWVRERWHVAHESLIRKVKERRQIEERYESEMLKLGVEVNRLRERNTHLSEENERLSELRCATGATVGETLEVLETQAAKRATEATARQCAEIAENGWLGQMTPEWIANNIREEHGILPRNYGLDPLPTKPEVTS